jgi:hypothetical protein
MSLHFFKIGFKLGLFYSIQKIYTTARVSAMLCMLACATFSCSKYYLAVQQQWVDVNYLASAQINTPDPRKANPSVGQMLILDWYIPSRILSQKPHIELDLIFWDYTTKTVTLPIKNQLNYTTYELLDEEYEKTGGILTYQARIVTPDGTTYRESKHQLWVKLITIEE